MQKIYFLVEKNEQALFEYINKIDSFDTEIHIYDSIIESCDANLFYLACELFSIFCENDLKCSIFTDVKEIYILASSIYYPFFDNIQYIEQNIQKRFEYDIDYVELFKYESEIFDNGIEKQNMKVILDTFNTDNVIKYNKLLQDIINVNDSDLQTAFYIHICRSITLYAVKSTNLYISSFVILFFKSMLMKIEKKPKNTNDFLLYYIEDFSDDAQYDYFIWNQIKRGALTGEIETDSETNNLRNFIYRRCFKTCKEIIGIPEYIPYEQRNKGVVIVLSIQYLSGGHAPTKTIIERCKTLKKIGKKVYFINTTEQYDTFKILPYFKIFEANVLDDYYKLSEIDMNGEKVRFCQLDENTSIIDKYTMITQAINKIKPEYILSIGTGSILADLCSYKVPCAEMALTFSTLPYTENCIPILGRRFLENEAQTDRNIIQSRFTFELNKQKYTWNREKFQIPEEKFVIVIIGIRLDYEITDEFLKMLSKLCEHGIYVVFAGVYDAYSDKIKDYMALKQNSTFIGYCNDVLALMEISDLYVNPERIGGGFSVIEAFYKGKPGVYLKYGDVFAAGGTDFAVDTLNDMYYMILRYKDDIDFYKEQSEKAKRRAAYMTSSVDAMKELDEAIIKKVTEIDYEKNPKHALFYLIKENRLVEANEVAKKYLKQHLSDQEFVILFIMLNIAMLEMADGMKEIFSASETKDIDELISHYNNIKFCVRRFEYEVGEDARLKAIEYFKMFNVSLHAIYKIVQYACVDKRKALSGIADYFERNGDFDKAEILRKNL